MGAFHKEYFVMKNTARQRKEKEKTNNMTSKVVRHYRIKVIQFKLNGLKDYI